MSTLDNDLNTRLTQLREQGLYRELRQVQSAQAARIHLDGQEFLNFSSNDYLGLANEPALKEAAQKTLQDFGTGSGASRLICGSLKPHHDLDEALAAFKGTAAALSFSSGYATALGTICALLEKEDVIIIDKLVHASIVDAARLSGATLRVFAHNDPNDLEKKLKWAVQNTNKQTSASSGKPRVLVVTESVFSMDGDLAPLREIAELKDQYGAWLMVDEAHATGLFGEKRRGLAEAFELAERVDIHMGTLGKALGSAGGYICGSRPLIDFLINRARSFIFSTAPSPASSAAARAALEIVQSPAGELRRNLLWARVDDVKNGLTGGACKLPVVRSAILPLGVGEEKKAMNLAALLRERGIFIPAIRYPTVARGEARLRLTVTATHTMKDVEQLTSAFREIDQALEGGGTA
ncbi:MAG TPA: 8-amino-7-oxononanoate synthase [Candidatus Saccharimonadales bacterium]|nr:8-amino-7-oxononanoate synthase [Candidatus Saccharimonadales bacterium]